MRENLLVSGLHRRGEKKRADGSWARERDWRDLTVGSITDGHDLLIGQQYCSTVRFHARLKQSLPKKLQNPPIRTSSLHLGPVYRSSLQRIRSSCPCFWGLIGMLDLAFSSFSLLCQILKWSFFFFFLVFLRLILFVCF